MCGIHVYLLSVTLQSFFILVDNSSQLVTSSVKSADVANPWSGVQAKAGMKKLRYCLKELKECGKINSKAIHV